MTHAEPKLGPATQDYLLALFDGCDSAQEIHKHTGRSTANGVHRTLLRMAECRLVAQSSPKGSTRSRWHLTGAGVMIARGLQRLQRVG